MLYMRPLPCRRNLNPFVRRTACMPRALSVIYSRLPCVFRRRDLTGKDCVVVYFLGCRQRGVLGPCVVPCIVGGLQYISSCTTADHRIALFGAFSQQYIKIVIQDDTATPEPPCAYTVMPNDHALACAGGVPVGAVTRFLFSTHQPSVSVPRW